MQTLGDHSAMSDHDLTEKSLLMSSVGRDRRSPGTAYQPRGVERSGIHLASLTG